MTPEAIDIDSWRTVRRAAEIGPIDRDRFEQDIVPAHRPVILRGQVDAWPLVAAGRAGPHALAEHLRARSGDRTAEVWVGGPELEGRFRYRPDFRALNFERKAATIDQICTLLLRCLDEPSPPSLFAGAVYLPEVVPAIVPELAMPLLDAAQERLTSLWIGNASRTAAHYDRPHNLACVVSGERRFLMFPTEQVGNLYVGPIDFTPAGQAISLVDCETPDFERHPKFREALAAAELAVLGPGDVLYIPPLWWHYVQSPSPMGAQVNFWWVKGRTERPGPMDTVMHALLTLRDLSPGERAGWRALFDHYVFSDAGRDLGHIPPTGLGVLGALDDEARARLRRYLAEQLMSGL